MYFQFTFITNKFYFLVHTFEFLNVSYFCNIGKLKILITIRIINNKKIVCIIFQINQVFVVCQSSGRIDQIISNINTLYQIENLKLFQNNVTVCLLSYDSFTWLLQPGKHTINVGNALKQSNNAWCGLIPMGEKCENVTTTGLKWNLGNLVFKILIFSEIFFMFFNFFELQIMMQCHLEHQSAHQTHMMVPIMSQLKIKLRYFGVWEFCRC